MGVCVCVWGGEGECVYLPVFERVKHILVLLREICSVHRQWPFS